MEGRDRTTVLLEHYRVERRSSTEEDEDRFGESWKQIRMIGEGGYGKVYLEQSSGGNFRAAKRVRKHRHLDFQAELVALTRLARPAYEEHFGKFLGWYDDAHAVWLLMEYFELGDLNECLSTGPLSEQATRDIAKQLLSGLNVMHKDGFVHRDLKPQNIFIVQKTPHWRVKIGDFGIAKRIHSANSFLQSNAGTAAYMAPEITRFQVSGSTREAYTKAVDIWSLGIIVHELLTCDPPFENDAEMSQYCQAEIELPVDGVKSQRVSDNAIDFIKYLLNPDASQRPDAATALKHPWVSREPKAFANHGLEEVEESKPAPGIHRAVSATSRRQLRAVTEPAAPVLRLQSGRANVSQPGFRVENSINRTRPKEMQHLTPVVPVPKPRLTGELRLYNSSELSYQHAGAKMREALRNICHVNELDVKTGVVPDISKANTANETMFFRSMTKIHWAAARGAELEIQRLLSRPRIIRFSVDETRRPLYFSPLHAAAACDQRSIAVLLIDRNASINQEDRGQCIPLHRAAVSGSISVTRLLLDHGAYLNAKTDGGSTPLIQAARGCHLDVVRLLLDRGAEVDLRNLQGDTALLCAALRGQYAIVSLLIQYGADANVQNRKGSTGVHLAASRDDLPTARVLIEQGAADLTVRNKKGERAEDVARRAGHQALSTDLKYWSDQQSNEGKLSQQERQASGNPDLPNVSRVSDHAGNRTRTLGRRLRDMEDMNSVELVELRNRQRPNTGAERSARSQHD